MFGNTSNNDPSPAAGPTRSIVGLIGHPVGHSISPSFQQAAFDALRLPFRYEAWDTDHAALPARVASLRHGVFAGANVTVPHKESVVGLLDLISTEAAAIGALNTIVRGGNQLAGHNTDVIGFLEALKHEGGFDVSGARVCVLGAGGAARAVVYALLRGGAARIAVYNRTHGRAESLVEALDPLGGRCVAVTGDAGDAARAGDLIVNCTSLGMSGGGQVDDSPLSASQIPAGAFVCDIVANPEVTPLLRVAREQGCRTLGGLPMLVRQGAAAFSLWTEQPAPLDVMFQAARRAMALQTAVPDPDAALP